ncbi:MAG: patatin-like phospholipase family protein [Bacteroidota bacterium]
MFAVFRSIYHSFPVQLLLLHLRSNLLLLTIWALLLLLMSGRLGKKLGFQYLFLDPEYLGGVHFWSFFSVGLALGGCFASWNLTTYLLTAQHFPFLASLSRPFRKFCINNFLLPLAIGLFYLVLIGVFQFNYEDTSLGQTLGYLLAVLLGSGAVIGIFVLYFSYTNRDISYYRHSAGDVPPNLRPLAIVPGQRKADLDYIKLDQNRMPVRTYLGENLKARLVRSVAHYESSLLLNIFKQNHLNALALQLIVMMVLLILGYLVDWKVFRIPAAASILILCSVLIAFIGALTYWFAEWRAFVIILLLITINYFTSFGPFNHPNLAYGLNYHAAKTTYTYPDLQALTTPEKVAADKAKTLQTLHNRLERLGPERSKPKLVLLCASGGGLKAATWSTHVLQQANQLTEGRLLDHTILLSGASGGMLGMAYFRELHLRQQTQTAPVIDAISADLLNSVAFTIVTNDLFLPWRRFSYGGQQYFRDRGYVFEQQFSENTDGILDKPLSAYQQLEASGQIPLLYLSPTILNDGRQMLISPQPISFMMAPPVGLAQPDVYEIDAVDFRALLRHHQPDSLRFLSALRANATYPYILPTMHLPTSPQLVLADAGFRDNYGIQVATRFIQVFQDWIKTHTSGVVLVQLTSSEKIEQITELGSQGVIESLFNPLGIANKTLDVQEFNHDHSLGFIHALLGDEYFEVVRFIYRPIDEQKLAASVSFHLTDSERKDVLRSLALSHNQASLRRLQVLLAE